MSIIDSVRREGKPLKPERMTTMKTMKEITNIICNIISDAEFDRLQNAEYDRWDIDSKVSRNGKARLTPGPPTKAKGRRRKAFFFYAY